jgi:hypothetical protein
MLPLRGRGSPIGDAVGSYARPVTELVMSLRSNQAVDFILADPELSRAAATWGAMTNIGEASTKPFQRLPHDELYRRVREYLEKISSRPG